MATEIRALLDEGVGHLRRVAEDPRHEAEILLGAALGRPRAYLLAHPEQTVRDCEATDRYEAGIRRRALGEPIAYILGEKEFWSLPIGVRPGVLIPRPETELLVERSLRHLPARAGAEVLDLAAGTGAIALAIASERPDCRVIGTDASAEAVAVARGNAERLGLSGRVEFRQGHWLEPVTGRRFNVIVSNPPYIAEEDPRVEPGVRRFEPHAALFAGPSGLEALTLIAAQAPAYLEADGWLVLEHGDRQGDAVRRLLEAGGLTGVVTHRDLAGRERCTEGCRPPG